MKAVYFSPNDTTRKVTQAAAAAMEPGGEQVDLLKAPLTEDLNVDAGEMLVVGMPVYCMDTMEYFPVEVQFRTMSMDFWASMEHRICYKKSPEHRESLEREFKEYARVLQEIEERFEKYSDVAEKR